MTDGIPNTVAFLHLGAARGVADLPTGVWWNDANGRRVWADIRVAVEWDDTAIHVWYSWVNGSPTSANDAPIYGEVEAYAPGGDTGPCLGAYVVRVAQATKGFGPLLYDVVMEVAGSKGLTPDRSRVSPDALRVWSHYLNNRPDVTTKQLDFRNSDVVDEDPNNDCGQKPARQYSPDDPLSSPLAKVYYATGTPTVDALRAAGRLIDY